MRISYLALVFVVASAVPSSAQIATPEAANAKRAARRPDQRLARAEGDAVAAGQAMPAKKFGYKPTPRQRTYGEQILHVAIGNIEMMRMLGTNRPRPFSVTTDPARPIPSQP